MSTAADLTQYGSPDMGFVKDRISKSSSTDNTKNFNYFMLGNMRFVYATASRLAVIKFIASMNPSADVLALASAEFDISAIPEVRTFGKVFQHACDRPSTSALCPVSRVQ
eukprot:scaffold536_cov250-Pinguiococcus_pyrenoidosus.AAC.11